MYSDQNTYEFYNDSLNSHLDQLNIEEWDKDIVKTLTVML